MLHVFKADLVMTQLIGELNIETRYTGLATEGLTQDVNLKYFSIFVLLTN